MIFYVASKTRHAAVWKRAREAGIPVNATWIDEAGPGESADLSDLAVRCVREAAAADATVLYCEPGDFLKGALIEAGAALAAGKEVRSVGRCPSVSDTFLAHPRWREFVTLAEAFSADPLTPVGGD